MRRLFILLLLMTSGAIAQTQHDEITPLTVKNVEYVDGVRRPCTSTGFTAAIAALPATGGTVDARICAGAQTLATDPFTSVTKNVTILWGAATYAFTLDTTIPANITQVFSQGAVLAPVSGKTLTIRGDIQAPISQIFGGAGTIALGVSTARHNGIVYPEWWGAVADNTTDVHTQFQAAITAAGASGSTLQCGVGGRIYFIGTVGLAVTSSNMTIQGVSGVNKPFIRYEGTGNALTVGDGTNLVYNFEMKNISITSSGGTAAKGLSLLNASQFNLRDVFIGGVSSLSTAMFTDALYIHGSGIATIENLSVANSVNGVNLDMDAVNGAPTSISFIGNNTNFWHNTNHIKIQGGLNISFRDVWAEWAENFLLIDNNGTAFKAAGALVETLIFENVRFINGPNSPYQGGHIISILSTNGSKATTLRGLKFKDSTFIQSSAVAGTVVASPVRVAITGASSILVDVPWTFDNCIFEGGNTSVFNIDTTALSVEVIGGLMGKDAVVGGKYAESAIFAGVGTSWNRIKYTNGILDMRRPFAPNLILRGGGSQSVRIDFYREGITRTAYIGNPNTSSDSFNIVQEANAAIIFQGHASNNVFALPRFGVGPTYFSNTATFHVYDSTATTGSTTAKFRAGAGQRTTSVLSVTNSALDAEKFGVQESGDVTLRRIHATNGTVLVAGDFALSAGWGASAAVSRIDGTDQAVEFTVAASGAGIVNNPKITLTFKDGTWTNNPIAVACMGDGGTGAVGQVLVSTTATTAVVTFVGLPVAGLTYQFKLIVMGR